jgi:hypothetical protein
VSDFAVTAAQLSVDSAADVLQVLGGVSAAAATDAVREGVAAGTFGVGSSRRLHTARSFARSLSQRVGAGVASVAAAVMGRARVDEAGVSIDTRDLALRVQRIAVGSSAGVSAEQLVASGTVVDYSAALATLGGSALDLRAVVWAGNPFVYGGDLDVRSRVLSLQIGVVPPGSTVSVTKDVSGLSLPMQFRVAVAPGVDALSFRCSFWDTATQSWSAGGVVLLQFESDGGRTFAWCATLHLTDFSVSTSVEVRAWLP